MLIITLALLSLSQLAMSQAAIVAMIFGDKVASEKFNISMELGLPMISYADADDIGLSLGGQLGIGANAKISDNWYLCPAVYFLSIKSVKMPSFSLNTSDPVLNTYYKDASAHLIMGSTDLNLMVFYEPDNSNVRIGLSPQVSFSRNANITYQGEYGEFVEDASAYINELDYGVVANVGYFVRWANKGSGMIFNLRYYKGFKDVFTNDFVAGNNTSSHFSFHVSLPFITDELATKNLNLWKKKPKVVKE